MFLLPVFDFYLTLQEQIMVDVFKTANLPILCEFASLEFRFVSRNLCFRGLDAFLKTGQDKVNTWVNRDLGKSVLSREVNVGRAFQSWGSQRKEASYSSRRTR